MVGWLNGWLECCLAGLEGWLAEWMAGLVSHFLLFLGRAVESCQATFHEQNVKTAMQQLGLGCNLLHDFCKMLQGKSALLQNSVICCSFLHFGCSFLHRALQFLPTGIAVSCSGRCRKLQPSCNKVQSGCILLRCELLGIAMQFSRVPRLPDHVDCSRGRIGGRWDYFSGGPDHLTIFFIVVV